ncbi:MAG: hypothetical protein K2N95_05640 [Lachnospiraceae bacterium]|nr:hypothetical protein [Lachnospiraceae bacterium]
MRKSQLIQLVTTVILAITVVGCGTSKNEVPTIPQESVTETDIETDIKLEETQTGTETEAVIQADTRNEEEAAPETETHLQTKSQKAEDELEEPKMDKSETESEMQSETTAAPKTEMQFNTETQQFATEGLVSVSDYMVSVRGTAVALQGDMRDYVPALGEPDEYSAAKSCVEAGEDKIYIYGGVTIYTYVTSGADRIAIIEITGHEALPSGIHIGSTKADVIAAYGSGYTEEGTELLYETDGKTLGLQMEGDTVSFIELFGR